MSEEATREGNATTSAELEPKWLRTAAVANAAAVCVRVHVCTFACMRIRVE